MSSEPHRKIFQCRGAESGMAPVPLDSSGERDFLRERIGFYALATFVASVAFFAVVSTLMWCDLPSRSSSDGSTPST